MTFTDYQHYAATTAVYDEKYAIIYPALGLANEAGEVLGKIKKVLRDNDGEYTDEQLKGISAEIGDVLWYMSALCRDLGVELSTVAQENLAKLQSRKERGTLKGSGDKR